MVLHRIALHSLASVKGLFHCFALVRTLRVHPLSCFSPPFFSLSASLEAINRDLPHLPPAHRPPALLLAGGRTLTRLKPLSDCPFSSDTEVGGDSAPRSLTSPAPSSYPLATSLASLPAASQSSAFLWGGLRERQCTATLPNHRLQTDTFCCSFLIHPWLKQRLIDSDIPGSGTESMAKRSSINTKNQSLEWKTYSREGELSMKVQSKPKCSEVEFKQNLELYFSDHRLFFNAQIVPTA